MSRVVFLELLGNSYRPALMKKKFKEDFVLQVMFYSNMIIYIQAHSKIKSGGFEGFSQI